MAGGSNGNGTKKSKTLVQTRLNSSTSQCSYFHCKYKIRKKKNINQQESQRLKLLSLHHLDLLQKDIKRLFTESLYCDLKIVYKYKIIQTHLCIVRIRSPWLYDVLKPHFSYKNRTAFCFITQFGAYKQIKNFVRLLYTNLDISFYEQTLIPFILNAPNLFNDSICRETERNTVSHKNSVYCMNCCSFRNAAEKSLIEYSPTSSDMADSGLETGSMISPQGIISETSGTDLDEPNEPTVPKKNHEISKASNSAERNFRDQVCSRESTIVMDEISEYENRVISDPFYELNGESDDEEETNYYIPTTSSEITDTSTSYLSKNKDFNDQSLRGEKITQNGKKPNITIEQPVDMNNSSASSNYYFIDASSLNDDIDVATTNVVGYPNDLNGRLNWSNPQLTSSCYIPTSRSNNYFLNDDSFKLPNRKSSHTKNRYDDIAKFDKNLKFSESLEPFVESRKLKKFELLTQEESSNCKNKESLVVEIKEADSGESAQHSPCPDNTKLDSVQKVENKLTNIALDQEIAKKDIVNNEEEVEQEEKENEGDQEETEEIERRPSLIRRNTFELDANDEKLSSLRQEYERRQGNLVFQNSITQYSQHRLDGDSYFDTDPEPDPSTTIHSVQANSQVALRTVDHNVSLGKYDLDTTEKESKNNKSALNTVKESAYHSISRSASDKLLANCDDDEDISFKSLPVNINDELSAFQTKSKIRRNEAAPIISGGASSSNFQKSTDSPLVKRKTESTPIVSGGSVFLSEPQAKDKVKSNMSSSMTAWIVDMSDCQNNGTSLKKTKESRTSMFASFSRWSNLEKEKEKECEKPQHSSLGYFVNLEDIAIPGERPKQASSKHRRRPSDTASEKNYCEFFVDLSDKAMPTKAITPVTSTVLASSIRSKQEQESTSTIMASSQPSDSKKNIFSMFIDLSEPKTSGNKSGVAKSNSSSKLADKRSESLQRRDSDDRPSEERKPKSGVFMFIESDSPIVRRRTLSSSRSAFKRHSWNSDKGADASATAVAASPGTEKPEKVTSNEQSALKRIHKRAQSLSVDRVGDFRKLLGHKSSNSSHSLNEAAANVEKPQEEEELEQQQMNTEDTFEFDVRDTPPNSHVEIVNEELLVSLKNRNYQELDAINEVRLNEVRPSQQDECCSESSELNRTRKSETFDISSSASGPSSASDNLDFKFADLLDPVQQKSIVMSKTSRNHQENKLDFHQNEKSTKAHSAKTTPASFVRLSDLDKRPLSNSTNSSMIAMTTHENTYRLSSSVTETSWIESKLVVSARSNEPLHRTITKKLPFNLAIGSTKSENFDEFGNEGDAEAVISESDLSSLQSSMGRSGQGSTEETETSTSFALGKPYNRLGEDLLRMFLEEINPDVTIDVAGRRIKAHKCILSSRCQYFAAMFSGGWIESAGNIISLQGYSYNAVYIALCHIYSGESCIPDSISIVELATLADMLCLEGLKEVIGFTLKVKYCHLFHKPCNGCAVGVLECMPLAAAYGLDEVYRKSLRWITRHFVRIWPTKEFATLPRELMDKCYHQHIVHMSVDNVLQTIMDCDKLLTTLPNVRWAEPVFRLVSDLCDASMKYLTDNFTNVLGNESFQALDQELTWNISRLQDHLLTAAERLPPEQACKAYSKLDKMFSLTQTDDAERTKVKWSPLFMELMNKIRGQVEKCLIRDAARAARTNAWLKMGLELRRHIQQLACLVIIPNENSSKRPSRHSNFLKENPKGFQESNANWTKTRDRNLDLRKVKMAISEHNDRTLKQTPLLQTRKVMNKPKTDPLERKLQNEKLGSDTNSVCRPKSWPNKMEVKSRYLEPRNRLTTKEPIQQMSQDKTFGQQRRKIMISSSDSSRTSSPAMKRAVEKKALSKMTKVPIKKDGKALSSDSLTESSSRLNVKKDVASKSCGITRPESPLLQKTKRIEAGLSIDSLADSKKKPLAKKTNKLDTSMSTDSLMTDVTTITTPKSMTTNKSSPILGKTTVNTNMNQIRNNDKLKKYSPPTQQRNALSTNRRPTRSLESSTAASRNRAAAVVNTYHGSLSLRKSLLDAAKAPDIPSRALNSAAITRTSLRQSTQSVRSSFGGLNKLDKNERKDEPTTINQRSGSSPGSKRSPKSNINSRISKSTITTSKQKVNKLEDKSSNKVKSQTTSNADRDGPKFLNQSSRSGTFLKDEPTILKKSDIETAAIDV